MLVACVPDYGSAIKQTKAIYNYMHEGPFTIRLPSIFLYIDIEVSWLAFKKTRESLTSDLSSKQLHKQ